ncbi:MAG: ABC-F family ATP-binding cassette domain-containing protein [Patescibacteria group bacterium]
MVPLLQVNELSKKYSGQAIFSGLSFSVFQKQKIGIIGRNGAGKSTMFRIVLNKEESDSGNVIISSEARIGYIEQENTFKDKETGLAYLMRYSKKEEWQCRKVASRFKFTAEQLEKQITELSGGWQMRLKLSAMLLLEPNLFLLDEPTNYLDLGTIILLEDFLKGYKGGFLIISHDREFLKNTCLETMEITPHRCLAFPQPLEAYLAYKEQRAASEHKINEKLNREEKHMQAFVDRFRYKSSKATQAQALIKKIDKLQVHKISIEHNASTVRINIPEIEKKKNRVLAIDNLEIGYANKVLATGFNFDVKSGEKIIVVGDNGQGKSTFLKTLAGEIQPVAGKFSWFTGLKIAYYAQLADNVLNFDEQIGDYLRRVADSNLKTEKVLQMAGDFLFSGDDLKKTIGVLSGGEKSRLILAGLLLGKPDVLILDEPTNHLDFETVEALGLALSDFNGTIIFTSHDRTFANMVASEIIEISEGKVRRHYHDYEDYVSKLEKRLIASEAYNSQTEIKKPVSDYEKNKEIKKQIKSLENKIEKLEKQKKAIHKYFLDNPLNYDLKKKEELIIVEEEIKKSEEEWLDLTV